MKCLVFDISGDYGHFSAYFSTSSPISFSAPPPSTTLGIIGAILGLPKEKNQYLEKLIQAQVKIAIGLLKPVKKIRMGINLINTKGNYWVPYKSKNHQPRTQIQFEFLKDPCFRIWFTCQDDEIYQRFANMLREGRCYYSVSLGLSEMLATVIWVGEDDLEQISHPSETCILNSILPLSFLKERGLDIQAGNMFLKERLPAAIDTHRIVQCYSEYIIEAHANPIHARTIYYWRGIHGNVVFTNSATGSAC